MKYYGKPTIEKIEHRLCEYIRCDSCNKKIVDKEKYFNEIIDFCGLSLTTKKYEEHNNRYLKQCYYNLQEKYDRGIVSKEEWELIHKNIYGLIKEKI